MPTQDRQAPVDTGLPKGESSSLGLQNPPDNLPVVSTEKGMSVQAVPIRSYYDPAAVQKILETEETGLEDHFQVLREAMLLPDRDPKTMTVKLKAEQQLWNRKREMLRLLGLLADAKSTRTIRQADGTTIKQTISSSRLLHPPTQSAASEAATAIMRRNYQPPEAHKNVNPNPEV